MILETERLYLRSLEFNDAYRMSEYRSRPEVAQYQSWITYSFNDALKRIEQCQQLTSLHKIKTDYHLAIVLKENNYMIGDLFVEVVKKREFILGYTFDSCYWSNGYAYEMISAFCEHMKCKYGFKKVICYVYKENVRSIRLLRRLHFVKFNESFYYDDEGYMKVL